MNHRLKNLFAVATGVVSLSARFAGTPAELALAVRERLNALARAHDLMLPDLARTGGHATDRATTLHALLRSIAAPHAYPGTHDEERVAIDGPDVPVSGNAVTNLALLLHEFATNAAKYGALSLPTGRVRVACAIESETLRLVWQERGGPPIDGEPDAEGFGSLLARATMRNQFGGRMALRWEPEGLTIDLSIPLKHLAR
jgi:two-component system CheB/CheR fusion protein